MTAITATELDRVQGFLQELLRRDDDLATSPELAPRIAEHVTGNDRLSPVEQADLYREQFFLRHIESLEEDHLGIVHYLGEEGFDAFARAFLRAHPPRTTARITALSPGQSPPPVRMPTRTYVDRRT